MSDATQLFSLPSYLANLPANVKQAVFSSSWTAQALFRALSPLAKQYILRLTYVDGGVPAETMQLWLRPSSEAKHYSTLHQLQQLSVLQQDQRGNVQLNADFRRCLIAALSGRGQGASDSSSSSQAQQYQGPPPVKQLMDTAARHWQSVMLYILDAEGQLDLPFAGSGASALSIQDLLLSAGLVTIQGHRHELTSAGLRYLLQPTHEQVWLLLREYIKVAEQTSGQELASTLSFLMQLSFRRVWQPYALAALTAREQDIAQHMAQLGLVATCTQDGATFYCATPLAASLCGGTAAAAAAAAGGDEDGGSAAAGSGKGGGAGGGGSSKRAGRAGGGSSTLESSAYIIVETNFRVYAHTSSPLQRRVLSRLMRTDCLLPNMFVGTLTREAFMPALDMGLTAADITRFLQQHAHPQVARRVPSVPENVQEQLTLWEGETRRVVSERVTYYCNFEDEELFAHSLSTAQGHRSVVWAQAEGRLSDKFIIIRRSGHEALRNFIVEYKKQRAPHQM